jgi:hypothetical protein
MKKIKKLVFVLLIGINMGEMKNAYKILVRKHEGKRPFEDLGIDQTIILKQILEK